MTLSLTISTFCRPNSRFAFSFYSASRARSVTEEIIMNRRQLQQ